jgi:hypothetical protein
MYEPLPLSGLHVCVSYDVSERLDMAPTIKTFHLQGFHVSTLHPQYRRNHLNVFLFGLDEGVEHDLQPRLAQA